MKSKFFLLVLSMSLLQSAGWAQTDFLREPDLKRPLLFSDLPDQLNLRSTELEKLFDLSTGAFVELRTSQSILIAGKITSVATQNDSKLLTVTIRLANRDGANLVVSAIRGEDGQLYYAGKILSFKHGDCFVLQKNEDNGYCLVKKGFYDVVGE